MLIHDSHILEAREIKGSKVILCYIRVGIRSIKYYYGQPTAHKTHRWMQPEHWAMFDDNLEMMVGNKEQTVTSKAEEFKERIFRLSASICVRVKQCSLPIEDLKRCILNAKDNWNIVQALEFLIEYKENLVHPTNQTDRPITDESILEVCSEEHEYKPSFVSPSGNGVHVPYTPSPKIKTAAKSSQSIFSTPNVKSSERLNDEERYSPRPIVLDSSLQEIHETPPQMPPYRPSPKNKLIPVREDTDNTDEPKKDPLKDQTDQDCIEKEKLKEKKINYEGRVNSNDTKQKLDNKPRGRCTDSKRERHKSRDRQKDDEYYEKRHKHFKRTHSEDRKAKENREETANRVDDTRESKSPRTNRNVEKRKHRECEHSKPASLRRSSRSPIKTKRLAADTPSRGCSNSRSPIHTSKYQHKKIKSINENLFGSDEDERIDEDFATKKSQKLHKPQTYKIPKILDSTKKRHVTTQDNHSEKKAMEGWLGKRQATKSTSSASSNDKDTKEVGHQRKPSSDDYDSRLQGPPEPTAVSYLSREEIEVQMQKEKLQMERNLKIKEALEQLAGPAPEKVDTLTLDDLSHDDVLNSFESYRTKLNEIFRRNSKKPHQIKGYNGINHYTVMSLIDEKKRMAMMNTLQCAYEPDSDGISAYLNLFINAMMPEWIICLFMDKHELTREEALKQIKAQDAYNLHMEAKMENLVSPK